MPLPRSDRGRGTRRRCGGGVGRQRQEEAQAQDEQAQAPQAPEAPPPPDMSLRIVGLETRHWIRADHFYQFLFILGICWLYPSHQLLELDKLETMPELSGNDPVSLHLYFSLIKLQISSAQSPHN
uniref:Uncharacterized protein n=1 Tax=Arundo donax TaxID=35708 RepID=A0A0A9EHF4_ARUDO